MLTHASRETTEAESSSLLSIPVGIGKINTKQFQIEAKLHHRRPINFKFSAIVSQLANNRQDQTQLAFVGKIVIMKIKKL